MSAVRDAGQYRSGAGGSETPENSRGDYQQYSRSRHGSISSSRFSSRMSRRSSVRDEVQTLDEFLRKQRVIRYMEEERERAERTKILRDEHDAWVEFRSMERAERLNYMTEQEIAELLQREAEEAQREKVAAEMASRRAAEDAARRRNQSIEVAKKKEEETIAARNLKNAAAEEARLNAERETRQRVQAKAEVEEARRISLDLRQREEDLVAKCKRLERELDQAQRAADDAKKAQIAAQNDLAREKDRNRQAPNASARREEDLQREIDAQKRKLDSAEVERKRFRQTAKEKDDTIIGLETELEAAIADREKMKTESTARDRAPNGQPAAVQERKARLEAEKKAERLQAEVAQQQAQINDYDRLSKTASDRLQNEQMKRERAEKEVARLQDSLKKEHAARNSDAKKLQEAQRSLDAQKRPGQDSKASDADRKRIAELERTVESLRRDKKTDTHTIECLKNELRSAQEEFLQEAAARAKFEELASQAVQNDNQVPREELLQAQGELGRTKRLLSTTRAEAKAEREKNEKEIEELKDWCAKLRGQHQRQMQELEYTPRHSVNDPQVTPRQAGKEVDRLQAEVRSLNEQLKASKERERRAAAEASRASQPKSPSGALAVLQRENNDLKRRYNDMCQQHNDAESARVAAEMQVESQKRRLGELESEKNAGVARLEREEAAGRSGGDRAHELEDRIKALEKTLDEERAAREAVQKEATEAESRAQAAEERASNAEIRAAAVQSSYNASHTGSQGRKSKTTSGCC